MDYPRYSLNEHSEIKADRKTRALAATENRILRIPFVFENFIKSGKQQCGTSYGMYDMVIRCFRKVFFGEEVHSYIKNNE